MIPAIFVSLSSLPLTPNGKVDRAALPAPEDARPDLQKAFVAPRNDTEKELAGIWSTVLGVSEVGVHDNFLISAVTRCWPRRSCRACARHFRQRFRSPASSNRPPSPRWPKN